jgi:hypothetical protein
MALLSFLLLSACGDFPRNPPAPLFVLSPSIHSALAFSPPPSYFAWGRGVNALHGNTKHTHTIHSTGTALNRLHCWFAPVSSIAVDCNRHRSCFTSFRACVWSTSPPPLPPPRRRRESSQRGSTQVLFAFFKERERERREGLLERTYKASPVRSQQGLRCHSQGKSKPQHAHTHTDYLWCPTYRPRIVID